MGANIETDVPAPPSWQACAYAHPHFWLRGTRCDCRSGRWFHAYVNEEAEEWILPDGVLAPAWKIRNQAASRWETLRDRVSWQGTHTDSLLMWSACCGLPCYTPGPSQDAVQTHCLTRDKQQSISPYQHDRAGGRFSRWRAISRSLRDGSRDARRGACAAGSRAFAPDRMCLMLQCTGACCFAHPSEHMGWFVGGK